MTLSINWTRAGAVLFDLDGVVTPTARIHERAWADLFADYDFTPDDYLASVDGRPRYDGVQTFLRSRGVELPWGDPSDPPGDTTVCAMGNRKNDSFNAVLERDGIAPYPGTMVVIDALDAAGVPSAIVSSSRNARAVLAAAEITDRFVTVVDGTTAAEEHLAGKPDPAMFLAAAAHVDVDPARCIVVEDATSGVAAGAAGGFSLVIGIDRGGNRESLLAAGADLVVDDLDETIVSNRP
ncbi:HAD superfamily hydrolase (TIGR01509 family)/beta-phosphoglucomutase family hydrolase [Ilumatobacter fluminis]|uniref:HAD superfamily hydrolase (TIGR01509 family)/beta-phosphoglucomutase family hydrolase n=1 Tax=Ilumatobacter fluminis TaxID=467091 RepID=A0A4R7I0T0_9ACTN|nr:beta-phosphoglucomutase family hydrolase [Ilumatobacter fluminis]TDT16156.1 HAD superfamily hydrolase (TIGR01509 family)/beta-phosphoglucomutase family hydrolase [Ilumatobacter fluminis]